MVTCTGHIGIHEGAEGRTDVHDVMAIKPNFLTSMGYHIFLTMALRARAPSARGAPLLSRDMSKLFLAQLNGNIFYHFLVVAFTFMVLTLLGASFANIYINIFKCAILIVIIIITNNNNKNMIIYKIKDLWLQLINSLS